MIGCCFKLTLQMLSMPFCVKPFFRNFKQLGGGAVVPTFCLCSFFLWPSSSSVLQSSIFLKAFSVIFHLWPHNMVTLLWNLYLPFLIFKLCVIFQGFFLCLFPCLADDTHILGPTRVVSLTFDHFVSQLAFVGLFVQPHKCSAWVSFVLPLRLVPLVALRSLASLLVLPTSFFLIGGFR